MFTNRLKSGEKVYLHKWGDTESKGILTRVEIFHPGKKEVLIYAPQSNGRVIQLSTETFYDIRMFGETAEYRFKVKFMEHTEADGFPLSRFKLMHDGEKSLRRDAYRLNLDAMVLFSVVEADGNQSEKDEGKVVDLSAGGARILTNRVIDEGELLNLSIQLDNDLLIAFGDIRFSDKAPPTTSKSQTKYAYQYGISFVLLADSDQEKIIRYIYKKQREELRNVRRNR